MEKEKNNQKNKECPLCKVSEETIEKLKEKETPPKISETETRRKSPWKFKVWFLIFVLATAGFAFYQLARGENPTQEQSEKKNQTSVLDIIFGGSIEVGDLAPDFISEDVFGNKISLNDFRGEKPVLLVFWATWCGYCTQEIPDLKAFAEKHQAKLQVIAVSSGETRETIRDYIQEKDVNFLMLLDEERKIWNEYLVRGTPSHFFISSQGKIVALRPGLALREDLEIMMTMLTELW